MKQSSFRYWVQNIYIDNCEEHDLYRTERLKLTEYFNKYKWWLKREYQFQRRKTNGTKEERPS